MSESILAYREDLSNLSWIETLGAQQWAWGIYYLLYLFVLIGILFLIMYKALDFLESQFNVPEFILRKRSNAKIHGIVLILTIPVCILVWWNLLGLTDTKVASLENDKSYILHSIVTDYTNPSSDGVYAELEVIDTPKYDIVDYQYMEEGKVYKYRGNYVVVTNKDIPQTNTLIAFSPTFALEELKPTPEESKNVASTEPFSDLTSGIRFKYITLDNAETGYIYLRDINYLYNKHN